MKQSRIFSVAVASAAVIGSVVAVSGTANAVFDPTTADRVTTNDQLGQEVPGTPYPATGWFLGDVAAPAGEVTFDGAGLNSAGGDVQVLNAFDAPASTLTDLVLDADFASVGDATFQVPIFANATGTGTDFTTLRPVLTGDEGFTATSQWVTSQALGTYAAGAVATLAEFQAQIAVIDAAGDPAADAAILAYGFITPSPLASSVQAVAFGDESTWFIPAPTGTYQPATVTVTQARTTGITVDGAGFFPNEELEVYFVDENAQGASPLDVVLTADAQGRVQDTVVIPADAVPAAGSYVITIGGLESGVILQGAVTVTADAVVAPVPVPAGPTAPVAVPVRANAAFTG
ncbi:hypothetical protein ES689_13050 [Frigoribacterium sp. ACAM 257]|uniref:hypothetical protein n=1 Tax=Frigoribacterium sp. ACAM 257 TaxID=2508998 RepID=UPI0011B97B4F|nr:hypothetical protein [Frigoribacterium sp. ACAM 257]TWX35507.1 hypothetical protein ES689_13050 [Frigoribacterium sp. ACAM 257]